jgi:hypothetical protein
MVDFGFKFDDRCFEWIGGWYSQMDLKDASLIINHENMMGKIPHKEYLVDH